MSSKKAQKRKLSQEEYRRALLKERRRTMRTVRNTLIGIAVLAALWFFILIARDRTMQSLQNEGSIPSQSLPVQEETQEK